MKKPDGHIEEQVRRALQVLDDLPGLQVSPFFRVHLMQRIETIRDSAPWYSDLLRPEGLKVKLAFAALLLAINIGSATLFFSAGDPLSLADAGEALEQLSDEYSGEELAYYVDTADAGSNRQSKEPVQQEQKRP
ncbi:MAG: hypothetical protein FJZ79_01645 [Chlorobi bacterium]|nr:hypothetical protein [Chlorobiota bacterium]